MTKEQITDAIWNGEVNRKEARDMIESYAASRVVDALEGQRLIVLQT